MMQLVNSSQLKTISTMKTINFPKVVQVENITQFCWKYSSSIQQWKNFENRLRFEKVIAKSLVASFFGTRCILCTIGLMKKEIIRHDNIILGRLRFNWKRVFSSWVLTHLRKSWLTDSWSECDMEEQRDINNTHLSAPSSSANQLPRRSRGCRNRRRRRKAR